MAHHRVQQWATFARQWWLYDARRQCPFKTASVLITHLSGKHKPIYHPLSDLGDHVVVINTKEVVMKDDRWRTWKHFHHTGYPGGFSATRAWKVHREDPTRMLYKAVYDSMEGNLLRRPMIARLHLYPDQDVPPEILKNVTRVIRQVQEVPRTLEEYTQEERDNFPRLFAWPVDYVKREKRKSEEST